MSSILDIYNLALSHVAHGKEVGGLTERSDEQRTCTRFYEQARDTTLRAFNWPFATKIAALGLVEEDPNDEWGYSYQYPSDCLKVRRILSGTRVDTAATRVPYKIIDGTSGLLILTDQADAEIEYTIRADDPTKYPPDFVMALSFRLASYIAPRLTAGDPFKLGERCVRFFDFEIAAARGSAVNEEQPGQEPDNDFLSAR